MTLYTLAATLVLVLSASSGHADADASWPVYRGDSQLRGTAEQTVREPLVLRWTFRSGSNALGPPVVDDGRVYVGSYDGHLMCLNQKDGTVVWKAAVGDDVEGSPLLVDDLVVAGTASGKLVAVERKQGVVRWTFEAQDRIVGGPNLVTVQGEKRVVFGSHDMQLYCVKAADGSQVWSFKTENFVNATPAVSPQGIVFGGCDGLLHVLKAADGTPAAAIEVGSYIAASVAVDEGVAFLGHYGGEAMAVDLATREVRWRHSAGDRAEPFFAPPAVRGKRVIFGNRDGTITCLQRTSGDVLWRFRTRNSVEAGAVIAGDRCIVASTDGRLYVLGLASGEQLWSYDIGAGVSVSPAVSGQHVLVAAEDGTLYMFTPASREDTGRK